MTRHRALVAACLALAAAASALLLVLRRDDGPEPVRHGPRDERLIALTFDADMTYGMLARLRSGAVATSYDEAIVDVLRATKTPATIFVTGLWAQTYAGVVRELARDPQFEIENHSVDHAAFQEDCFGLPSVESDGEKATEIAQAAATITDLTGVPPRYFRFPGGCHNADDVRLVRSLGETAVGWDVNSADAFSDDPHVVAREVLDNARAGSIVVLHLNGAPNAPATAAALRRIIPELRRRGYRFVTLRTLLGDE